MNKKLINWDKALKQPKPKKLLDEQKMQCRNCQHWLKVNGAKSKNKDRGKCKLMTHIIDNNSSQFGIEITKHSDFYFRINGLEIATTDQTHIKTHVWIVTKGNFFCGEFTKK